IDATKTKRGPDLQRIAEIAGEAFIPLAYGGGISTIEQVKDLFYTGVEKVIFNYQAVHHPSIITESAKLVGSQSVVASIDVKKNWLGKYKVYTVNGTEQTGLDPIAFAKQMTEAGAGEIFLNAIDKDGTYGGYDLDLLQQVAGAVSVPVVACGGASGIDDFVSAVKAGASAVAAGSLFVFQRPHQAVLISYPSQQELKQNLFTRISY
ncbi:MAG: imidazole glycerol phosphate synthase subunit HisF, partial [Bacteroidota bacterium]|nr:imidazole glycerol phosphate synthase subunit HisF [Bacteroidota bacterium]